MIYLLYFCLRDPTPREQFYFLSPYIFGCDILKAVAIDTNLLAAPRATDLLSTPIQSRDHILTILQYR